MKIGDILICINDILNGVKIPVLTLGKSYTIIDITYDDEYDDESCIVVKYWIEIDDNGNKQYFRGNDPYKNHLLSKREIRKQKIEKLNAQI